MTTHYRTVAPAHRRQTRSFTLIELLVVVAILTIISAILLPALVRARQVALRTTCVNNLKQIGLGLHAYAGDYDDWFPTWWDGGYAALVPPKTSYITSDKTWACPVDELEDPSVLNSSYIYFFNQRATDSDADITHLGAENDTYHYEDLRNVLFLDGHVAPAVVIQY